MNIFSRFHILITFYVTTIDIEGKRLGKKYEIRFTKFAFIVRKFLNPSTFGKSPPNWIRNAFGLTAYAYILANLYLIVEEELQTGRGVQSKDSLTDTIGFYILKFRFQKYFKAFSQF